MSDEQRRVLGSDRVSNAGQIATLVEQVGDLCKRLETELEVIDHYVAILGETSLPSEKADVFKLIERHGQVVVELSTAMESASRRLSSDN